MMKYTALLSIAAIILLQRLSFGQCENVALGKPASASSSWNSQTPDLAFDGNCGTVWNAGNGPAQWIQVDLQNQYTVNNINLVAETAPNGTKTYNIYTSPDMNTWTLLESFSMYTVNGQLINRTYTNLTNVRGVKVETASGVSWVAWKEIGVFTTSSVSITPNGTIPICQGDTLTLTASQGLSYQWSTGDSTQNIAVTLDGTYNVTVGMSCVTDSTCINTDSVVVAVSDPSTAIVVDSSINCFGGSDGALQVTASGGFSPYTYSWSNGGTDPLATGLPAGTYYVTVTDSLGCTVTDTAVIGEPPALQLAMTQNADNGNCDGSATVSASGGTSPYFYQWDANAGNQTTQTADSLCAGNYCVTITDNNGCTADTCVSVPVGIFEFSETAAKVHLYPNPVTDQLNLEIFYPYAEVCKVELQNMAGQIVLRRSVAMLAHKTSITLDLANIEAGLYVLVIGSEHKLIRVKVVLQ